MTLSRRWLSLNLATVVVATAGCPGEIPADQQQRYLGGGPACTLPVGQVPVQIIAVRCATSGCHDSTTRSGSLDLGSPNLSSRLVSVPSATCPGHTLIVLGNDAMSFFLQKLNPSPACGVQMPNGMGSLSPGDLGCIRAWIDSLGDGGVATDGSVPDSGTPDAGTPDTGVDAGSDAADVVNPMDVTDVQMPPDVGPPVDVVPTDMGVDTGTMDAGTPDAGVSEAGE